MTFIPELFWFILTLAEVFTRKVKKDKYKVPPMVDCLALGIVVVQVCMLTYLLFGLEIKSVSVAGVVSHTTQIFLWSLVCYCINSSYSLGSWSLSKYYSIKGLFFSRPFWLLLQFGLFWANFGKPQQLQKGSVQPSKVLEMLFLVCWSLQVWLWVYFFRKKQRLPRTESSAKLLEQEITEESRTNAYEEAHWFSKCILHWVFPLLKKGRSEPIEPSDVDPIRQEESADYQYQRMQASIKKYLTSNPSKKALFKAVAWRFKGEVVFMCLVGLVAMVTEYSTSIFIKFLEDFLMSSSPLWKGFALVTYMILIKFVQAIADNQLKFHSAVLGAHIKAGLGSVIYRKSLYISPNAVSENDSEKFSYGQVVNLMQVDLDNICLAVFYILKGVVLPVQWVLGVYLVYYTLGWKPGTSGFAIMVLIFLASFTVSKFLSKAQKRILQIKDKRVKLCNELLNNIKVFKLYNWEKKVSQKIKKTRKEELKALWKYNTYRLVAFTLNWGARDYITIGVVLTMVLMGETLTPGNIYAGITVIKIFNNSVRMLPDIVTNLMNTLVSLERIQNFLVCKEVQNIAVESPQKDTAVCIHSGNFSWETSKNSKSGELQEAKTVLKNINLSVKKEEFVAVVGKLGSGKSSLLQAIIQNMNMQKLEDSYLSVNGSVALVGQEAWIQNNSIKKNILFGSAYEHKKYKTVLEVSQLTKDFEALPAGENTQIGEKGINLSGGQKTRVAIARAIYSGHDILLLDDPLSAVDPQVGNAIFEQCFSEYLKFSTRVMATNNQQFLPYVDRILVMHEGRIIEQGTYSELVELNGYFKNEFLVETTKLEQKEKQEEPQKPQEHKEHKPQQEERVVGNIGWSVYKTYFEYMGGWKTLGMLMAIMVCWGVQRMYSDLFLANWTQQSAEYQRTHLTRNITIFTLATSTIVFFMTMRLSLLILKSLVAAKKLFKQMFNALLDAPINNFYDVTPSGIVLNRLSRDQNIVDNNLIICVCASSVQIFLIITVVLMCALVVPWALLAVPVALYLSVKVQKFYLHSSRELTRLESVSGSPIIQHFSETVSGAPTIRAFGYQNRFIKKNSELINTNIGFYFQQQACTSWLAVVLEFVADLVLAVSAFAVVAMRDSIGPGLAGACLTYTINLPFHIYFLIFNTSNLENRMVSVERIHSIGQVKPEAERQSSIDSSLGEWPLTGKIEFENYSMRYREETEVVLRNLKAVVKGGEKVGIVGRTGSGKSSLCLSLFRIVEAYSGTIKIDDVDIAKVGLDTLRKRLCVIPQDPVLFEGTLKENLDPFEEWSLEELKDCLKLTQLTDESPEQLLNREVKENGSNFSLGQRQLICIARAILKKAKIVVLDEATASIDYKTDQLIQSIIRDKFQNSTVLTIAHRMNTILDYDKVIVMEKGTIVEFDSPQNLIAQKGLFYAMTNN